MMWWLARAMDAVPTDPRWLTPGEAARAGGMRYAKRRGEYLLRRLVTKHAVAAVVGLPVDPASLARIDVRNAPTGAPFVHVDGGTCGMAVSISDRAGWAVCLVGPDTHGLGCDLELVEPRSPQFVRDYFTEAERHHVAAQADADARDAAANLLWSAKESALKVLRTGLRRDTRSVEVTIHEERADGWTALTVRATDGVVLPGWWCREGPFLLTVAATERVPPPVALEDPRSLAGAVPRHSWPVRPPGDGR
jgi:4'-phosphopantetheinyl transferase